VEVLLSDVGCPRRGRRSGGALWRGLFCVRGAAFDQVGFMGREIDNMAGMTSSVSMALMDAKRLTQPRPVWVEWRGEDAED
jgi:hypothetical protein